MEDCLTVTSLKPLSGSNKVFSKFRYRIIQILERIFKFLQGFKTQSKIFCVSILPMWIRSSDHLFFVSDSHEAENLFCVNLSNPWRSLSFLRRKIVKMKEIEKNFQNSRSRSWLRHYVLLHFQKFFHKTKKNHRIENISSIESNTSFSGVPISLNWWRHWLWP